MERGIRWIRSVRATLFRVAILLLLLCAGFLAAGNRRVADLLGGAVLATVIGGLLAAWWEVGADHRGQTKEQGNGSHEVATSKQIHENSSDASSRQLPSKQTAQEVGPISDVVAEKDSREYKAGDSETPSGGSRER